MVPKELRSKLTEKLVAPMLIVMIALAFVVGALWQKVENLQKGGSAATVAGQQTAGAATPAPTVSLSQIKDLFNKNLVKFGDANRKVLFVEIADPSCPYCHIAGGLDSDLNNQSPQFKLTKDGGSYDAPVPQMRKLVDDGKASFIWMYFPGHGSGEMGAKALYCANEKGKFWEVHDLLMSEKGYEIMNGTTPGGQPTTGPVVKNDKTKAGDLANFLSSAINPGDMKSCLDSGKYDQRLGDDMTVAKTLNVQGTPGFFINDGAFPGAYSYKDMQSAVDNALKS